MESDFDALARAHRFIRTEEDDRVDTQAVRMAKKYYDELFRWHEAEACTVLAAPGHDSHRVAAWARVRWGLCPEKECSTP